MNQCIRWVRFMRKKTEVVNLVYCPFKQPVLHVSKFTFLLYSGSCCHGYTPVHTSRSPVISVRYSILVRATLDLIRWLVVQRFFVRYNTAGFQRWADRYFGPLFRWSTAQRTTEMLADQRTGKNSGPAPADYRNWASASPLLNYLREVILSLKGPLTWEGMGETSCKFRRLCFKKTSFEWYHFLPNQSRCTVPLIFPIYSRKVYTIEK